MCLGVSCFLLREIGLFCKRFGTFFAIRRANECGSELSKEGSFMLNVSLVVLLYVGCMRHRNCGDLAQYCMLGNTASRLYSTLHRISLVSCPSQCTDVRRDEKMKPSQEKVLKNTTRSPFKDVLSFEVFVSQATFRHPPRASQLMCLRHSLNTKS